MNHQARATGKLERRIRDAEENLFAATGADVDEFFIEPFPDQHGEQIEHLRLDRPEPPGPAQLEPAEIKLTVAEHEDQQSLPHVTAQNHQSSTWHGRAPVSRCSPFFLQV